VISSTVAMPVEGIRGLPVRATRALNARSTISNEAIF
jgi:hypothetical protein